MCNRTHSREQDDFALPFGLFLGLLGGLLAGILFAPKPGRELQADLRNLAANLPDEVNTRWSRSKVRYQDLMGRTRQGIGLQLEKRTLRKQALRMAEAKRLEEMEAGSYEY